MTTNLHAAPGKNGASGFADEVRRTLNRLNELDCEAAGYLKALAFILHRVAIADNSVCTEEIHRMEQILVDHASLSRPEAILAVEIARHCIQIADCGCSYAASRGLRDRLGADDLRRIESFLHSVAAADGRVLRSEKAQIRQIAAELGLS